MRRGVPILPTEKRGNATMLIEFQLMPEDKGEATVHLIPAWMWETELAEAYREGRVVEWDEKNDLTRP